MLRTSTGFLGLITHNQPVRQKHISQAALSMLTQHLSNHMHVLDRQLPFNSDQYSTKSQQVAPYIARGNP